MSGFKLRDYQQQAHDAIFNYFESHHEGNPIVAMPPATGKSLVIASFIQTVFKYWPNQRVMMLTHVKELVEQNANKLKWLWPECPLGIHSAGLKRKDTALPVTFGNVQSVFNTIKKDCLAFGSINLLLIDECHLLSNEDDSMYQVVIKTLKQINPELRIIGLTATHYRLKQGLLINGNGLFTDICFDNTKLDDFNELIRQGYLSPLYPKKTDSIIDTSSVSLRNGDYNNSELENEAEKITYQALEETLDLSHGRKSWLIFSSGIRHAETIETMLNNMGIPALAFHSKLSNEENDKRIKQFKKGEIAALINNNKLTTGFDHPPIDLIVTLRPTTSPSLWVQKLGRGLRIAPGKSDCLVLDFAGNTARLGPINDPIIPKLKDKSEKQESPVKICSICGIYNNVSARFCICCGSEFKFKTYIETTADTKELIKTNDPVIEKFPVFKVVYSAYQKVSSSIPTLRVTYYSNLKTFNEWICIEHNGYARQQAKNWWKTRSEYSMPETVQSALQHTNSLSVPRFIYVRTDKKYPEILRVEF